MMLINVLAKVGAQREGIEEVGERKFVVRVRARAKRGAANRAIVRAVARHFGVAASRVEILSGRTSREKTLEVS